MSSLIWNINLVLLNYSIQVLFYVVTSYDYRLPVVCFEFDLVMKTFSSCGMISLKEKTLVCHQSWLRWPHLLTRKTRRLLCVHMLKTVDCESPTAAFKRPHDTCDCNIKRAGLVVQHSTPSETKATRSRII